MAEVAIYQWEKLGVRHAKVAFVGVEDLVGERG